MSQSGAFSQKSSKLKVQLENLNSRSASLIENKSRPRMCTIVSGTIHRPLGQILFAPSEKRNTFPSLFFQEVSAIRCSNSLPDSPISVEKPYAISLSSFSRIPPSLLSDLIMTMKPQIFPLYIFPGKFHLFMLLTQFLPLFCGFSTAHCRQVLFLNSLNLLL